MSTLRKIPLAVSLFCGMCVFVWCLRLHFSRLPLPIGWEDIFISDWLFDTFPLRIATIQSGNLTPLFTYALIHGSWWHFVINIIGLAVTGGALERILGFYRMFALIVLGVLGGALGFLLSVYLDSRLATGTMCMGASAVLTAYIGAITTLAPRGAFATVWVGFMPLRFKAFLLFPLLLAVLLTESYCLFLGTAYGAHLGGWVCGLGYGFCFRNDYEME